LKRLPLIWFYLSLLISIHSFSQKQANIWYFGEKAGLDFSNGCPEVITNGNMIAEAGCATICNSAGNLLFYTNGLFVWNREHSVMPNGDSILGSSGFNQNNIIIQKPGSQNIYCLFTIDSTGLFYSEVDLDLENGRGDITIKNHQLGPVSNKITAVKHCNAKYTWVIVHSFDDNTFEALLVTDSIGSFYKKVISEVGSEIMADLGYIKVSPAGDKIILPINSSDILLEIFDFNNKTGVVSNPVKIYRHNLTYCYGSEFSGDSRMLYISTGGLKHEIFQYDLTLNSEPEINNSAVAIAEGNAYALQIAPDQKIYVAHVNEPYIGVINFPEKKDTDCGYEEKKIYLNGRNCKMGLPNFNQSYFYRPAFECQNTCAGDSTLFQFGFLNNTDSVRWNLGTNEPEIVLSTPPFNTSKKYSLPDTYQVTLVAYHCEATDTIRRQIKINTNPDLELGNDTAILQGCTITIDAGNDMDQYLWNNGSIDQSLTVSTKGIYFVEITKDNCKSTDSIFIDVIPAVIALPNAFSPNGDGLNDVFKAKIAGKIGDFQLAIFNRYGQRVFFSEDPEIGWRGKYNGIDCPIETYVWEISFIVPEAGLPLTKKQKGYVHLLR
jgi:gliding motility-associated-like protein